MTIDQFFEYLESKAIQSPDIPHDPENKKVAFHSIDDPFDLAEFDNAIRNTAAFPAMLAEQGEGSIDDNESVNYTNTIEGAFLIVDERKGKEPIRTVRSRCFSIGKAILEQIRKDRNSREIIAGRFIDFRINGVQYSSVGPMYTKYYGYVFTIRFVCPFSF